MKKFKNKKAIIALALLGAGGVAALSLGLGLGLGLKKSSQSQQQPQNTNKQNLDIIKELSASTNLDVSTELKAFLDEIIANPESDKNKEILKSNFANDLKSTLVSLAATKKELAALDKKTDSTLAFEFIKKATELDKKELQKDYNNLYASVSVNSDQLVSAVETSKAKASVLETNTSALKKGVEDTDLYLKSVDSEFKKQDTIFSASKQEEINNALVEAYKKDKSITTQANLIKNLSTKAIELIADANAINSKANKNEKEQAALDKFNAMFNNGKLKDTEVVSDQLLAKINALITEFEQAVGEDKQLDKAKHDAQNYIDTLVNLSDELKNKYKDKIERAIAESNIDSTKQLATTYNSVYTEISQALTKSNTTKTETKYTQATNKEEYDQEVAKLQALVSDNKLVVNDDYLVSDAKINEIKELIQKIDNLDSQLNGNQSSDKIQQFKNEVESKLTTQLSSRVEKYGLTNLLYSSSISLENKDLFIDDSKVEGVELSLKDVYVSDQNINELNLVYKAQSKMEQDLVADVTKKVVFTNDLQTKINSVSINNLDDVFNFDYSAFNNYFVSDLVDKNTEIKGLFSLKNRNIDGFFELKMLDQNTVFENNKLKLKVALMLNKKQVKEYTLSTANNVTFKDDFWKGITIEPSDTWKESYFYKSPDDVISDPEGLSLYYKQFFLFNIWMAKDVLTPIKNSISGLEKKEFNNPIQAKSFKPLASQPNSLSPEELQQIFNKLNEDLTKLFKIAAPSGTSVELVDIDASSRFMPFDKNANVKVKVTKNGQSKEKIVEFRTLADDVSTQDARDFAEIFKLINTETPSDGSKIFERMTLKTKGRTHSDFLAKDAVSVINDLYNLPKIGKYELFAKELVSSENFVNSSIGGRAKVFFSIKKDGVEVPSKSIKLPAGKEKNYAKEISFFKPLNHLDVAPQNSAEWFSSADFTGKTAIPQADITEINKINSTNFTFRRVDGSIAKNNNKKYALVDVNQIVKEKAFGQLNYVLMLNTSPEKDQTQSGFQDVKPGTTPDDKPVSGGSSNTNFWQTPDNQSISSGSDAANNANVNEINKKYFMYFYDVKKVSDTSMKFKLGFIDKTDINKRYTNSKEITLTNLRNDYKENLYPEILLNRLTLNDLTIQNLNTISLDDFKAKVAASEDLSNYISLKNSSFSYNDFSLNNANFKIESAKNAGNNALYVRFKYTSPVTSRTSVGNIWYKLSGFSGSSSAAKEEIKFDDSKQALTTIFEDAQNIKRERDLEPYYKDLMWSFDSETNIASWTLKEKYIEQTLLKTGTKERKIKLHLFANTLVQNVNRLKSIQDGYWFDFDFEKLVNGEKQKVTQKTKIINKEDGSNAEYPRFDFDVQASYTAGEGIKFELIWKDQQHKMILGNPYKEAYTAAQIAGKDPNAHYGDFNPQKAFLLNNAGGHVRIAYTNSTQHEEFNQETNLFSFKNLDYNQENQPITFFTPEDVIKSDKYNPNQNVYWELHNGYKQDQEFMHKSWKNIDIVNNVRARSFGFSFGTATQFAKVSTDPLETKFYAITNNHVIGGTKETFEQKFGSNQFASSNAGYMALSAPHYENKVDRGFSYWNGNYSPKNIGINLVWTGLNQKDKKGNGDSFVDISVFAIDAKSIIETAKKEGKFFVVDWFQNWFDLENTKLEFDGTSSAIFFGPNLKNFAMNGFPLGNQNGYLLNRAESSGSAVGLSRQNGYAPTFYNSGNSGTGILGQDNQYISTINSGAPLTFLQSWNNETPTMNYFGVNYNNENPLDFNNIHSLASQIIKWHLIRPLEVSLPWYFRKINK
ncbi:MGA_1079 family surface serine endopeptidase [Mycoplasma procyoni]|uniref:MGA_1079 family surface serine endopeptidase n=1 Tax=Mycoplasma procyoni TaxID=568784 RepID=UPI00197B8B7C|nr:GA module-containing protein [Mycoplasma procyoni]MBN3535051.1 hypothetical protein [Mycoplasma procyoni]